MGKKNHALKINYPQANISDVTNGLFTTRYPHINIYV